jgi:hypothetical protein
MSEDEFTRLFNYMHDRFDTVEQKLDSKASQSTMDSLVTSIDSFIKRLDDHDVNMAARDRQFDRLLEWAHKVSAKTGIPLENF